MDWSRLRRNKPAAIAAATAATALVLLLGLPALLDGNSWRSRIEALSAGLLILVGMSQIIRAF